jgi:hypothetical protein
VIKLLVKLIIVALVANAAFHIGTEYLTYVRFREAIRDAAIFKAKNDAELMTRILALAEQYEIPLDEDNITIRREERRVNVEGWYDKPIEILPNYEFPWHFGVSVEVVVSGVPRYF